MNLNAECFVVGVAYDNTVVRDDGISLGLN